MSISTSSDPTDRSMFFWMIWMTFEAFSTGSCSMALLSFFLSSYVKTYVGSLQQPNTQVTHS